MTGHGVSEHDMPDFPWRADRPIPLAGDSALDELLTAGQPPQRADPGLLPAAAVLAALRAAPADGELAGQARALAEFRRAAGRSHRAGRVRSRRPVPPRARRRSKLAVVAAAAAVAVGGTAAAAYDGALPAPLQTVAHAAIAAPAGRAGTGGAIPAATGDRPFTAPSAAASRSHDTGQPGARHGQPGAANKHHKRERPGHRKDHEGRRGGRHLGNLAGRHAAGPAARHEDKPMVHHQGKPTAIATPPRSGIPHSARRL